MIRTEVLHDELTVFIFDVKYLMLHVNNRFQSNGYRRPRTTAIYMNVYHPITGWGVSGSSYKIKDMITMLESIGIDPAELIQICDEQGWQAETPTKDQMKMDL